MFDLFLGQCLVLLLLFISGVRVFFIKNPKIDAATVVSPFSFIVSLLVIAIWGFSYISLALCCLSFVVFVTNLRAIFRLSAELFVDHYSAVFIVASVIETVLTLVLAAAVLYFRPVRCVPKDFGVDKTVLSVNGNAASGFRVDSGILPETLEGADFSKVAELSDFSRVKEFFLGHSVSGTVTIYSPTEKVEWISSDDSLLNGIDFFIGPHDVVEPFESNDDEPAVEALSAAEAPLLIFVGSALAETFCYEPYFVFLAQKGFTVITADFFAPDMRLFNDRRDSRMFRRFSVVRAMLEGGEEFERIKGEMAAFTQKGYEALSSLVLEKYGNERKVFYITDGLSSEQIFAFSDKFPGSVEGMLQMEFIPEYKNVGLGFIEQTDILLAHRLGIARDGEFFIPRYLSFKTVQQLAGFVAEKKSRRKVSD